LCFNALKYTNRHAAYKFFEKNILRTNSITYAFQLPGMKMYMTIDPMNIKSILSTQFQEFGKGPLFYESWNEVIASTQFADDSFWVMGYSASTARGGQNVVLY
jgi:hypothetical protein